MPQNPARRFIDLNTALLDRAAVEAKLHDPDARQLLQKECNELDDRQWLHNHADSIAEQIERHRVIGRLRAAQVDTKTAQVTTKATALSKDIVTQALCDAFQVEIEELGLTTIKVELRSTGGQKGMLRFGVL